MLLFPYTVIMQHPTTRKTSYQLEFILKYTNPANRQSNFCMQKLWAPPMVPRTCLNFKGYLPIYDIGNLQSGVHHILISIGH